MFAKFRLNVTPLVRRKCDAPAVTVSMVNGEQATIGAGLSSGERVVVEGPADLREGSAVSEKKS